MKPEAHLLHENMWLGKGADLGDVILLEVIQGLSSLFEGRDGCLQGHLRLALLHSNLC